MTPEPSLSELIAASGMPADTPLTAVPHPIMREVTQPLTDARITTLGEAAMLSDAGLLSITGFGPAYLYSLKRAVAGLRPAQTSSQESSGHPVALRPDEAQEAVQALRLMVRDFGEWFSVRSTGRKVWQAAISLFADYEDATAMVLDFEDVQGITTTCADEMVPGLIRRMDDRVISVANASDQVAEALTTALARRGMAVRGIGEHVFFAALAEREQELRDLGGQLSDRDHQIATVRAICEEAAGLGPDAAGVAVAAVLAALAEENSEFEGIEP